jgi:hypothetical protein
MRQDSPLAWLVAIACAGMLVVAGLRWYAFDSARPDTLPGIRQSAVVAVVQARDCPDSRRIADRFVALATAGGLPARAVLIPDDRAGGLSLRDLAGVREARIRRRLHRAVLRSGHVSTPAILLLDRRGVVRFGVSLAADTPEDGVVHTLAVFEAAFGLLEPDPGVADRAPSAVPVPDPPEPREDLR